MMSEQADDKFKLATYCCRRPGPEFANREATYRTVQIVATCLFSESLHDQKTDINSSSSTDPYHPDFPGTFPVYMFERSVPLSPKSRFGKPEVSIQQKYENMTFLVKH